MANHTMTDLNAREFHDIGKNHDVRLTLSEGQFK